MADTTYGSNLATTAQNILRNRPRSLTLERIAADTGLSLGWLAHFGSAIDPARAVIGRVETLYAYLTGAPVQTVETLASRHTAD